MVNYGTFKHKGQQSLISIKGQKRDVMSRVSSVHPPFFVHFFLSFSIKLNQNLVQSFHYGL